MESELDVLSVTKYQKYQGQYRVHSRVESSDQYPWPLPWQPSAAGPSPPSSPGRRSSTGAVPPSPWTRTGQYVKCCCSLLCSVSPTYLHICHLLLASLYPCYVKIVKVSESLKHKICSNERHGSSTHRSSLSSHHLTTLKMFYLVRSQSRCFLVFSFVFQFIMYLL